MAGRARPALHAPGAGRPSTPCPGQRLPYVIARYHKSGGSILNGHYWSHIAFPFTDIYFYQLFNKIDRALEIVRIVDKLLFTGGQYEYGYEIDKYLACCLDKINDAFYIFAHNAVRLADRTESLDPLEVVCS